MSEMQTQSIIKNPRVTEKASMLYEQNVYTFDVTDNANKNEIKKAIFELYKVKPVKVNMLRVRPKRILSRGQRGVKKGGTKALVYLKKGDKIDIA